MSTDKTGLEGALADEADDDFGHQFQHLPDPKQLDMLRDEKGRLPNDALRQLRAKQRRGPGRPRGARNKHNRDVARLFIQKHGDPLDALGEIMNTPVDVLVEQLKLAQGGEAKYKPVRAMDAQMLRLRAIDIALPYIHGKQPVQVDLTTRADVILNIPGLTDPAHLAEMTGGGHLTPEMIENAEFVDADGEGGDADD